MKEIGRGKRTGGWRGKLLARASQIKCLSVSRCTVCAKLISRFLSPFFSVSVSLSGVSIFPCSSIHCDIFLRSTLLFSQVINFFLSLFFLLLTSFVGVVLQGVIVGATEATLSNQALLNRHLGPTRGQR